MPLRLDKPLTGITNSLATPKRFLICYTGASHVKDDIGPLHASIPSSIAA